MAPKERHPAIFKAWHGLARGGALVLVNDHDPIPLYYQLACEHTGTFRWEYLEQGPSAWRVRLSKGDYPDPGFAPPKKSCSCGEPLYPDKPVVVDTRPIFERGETPCQLIEEATDQTPPGGSFVLLVPFEPAPLYAKLAKQGFTHKTSRLEDGAYRIEFKRNA